MKQLTRARKGSSNFRVSGQTIVIGLSSPARSRKMTEAQLRRWAWAKRRSYLGLIVGASVGLAFVLILLLGPD